MKLQPIRKVKLPGRNKKCLCGSGKKSKHCCLDRLKTIAALPPHVRQRALVNQFFGSRTRPTIANSESVTNEPSEITVQP